MNKKSYQKNKSVPVTLENGIQAFVNPQNIPDVFWKRHHGKTAAGQEVNSIKTATIGATTLLQNGNGGPFLAVPTDDLEVFAKQFLAGKDYAIQAPVA